MAGWERRQWVRDSVSGLAQRERKNCPCRAYLPDPLVARRVRLHRDVADAEPAWVAANAGARTLVDTEALARLLLCAESVASSQMEGLQVGGRRLLRAEAARRSGATPGMGLPNRSWPTSKP